MSLGSAPSRNVNNKTVAQKGKYQIGVLTNEGSAQIYESGDSDDSSKDEDYEPSGKRMKNSATVFLISKTDL
jgi:hypothetical protein